MTPLPLPPISQALYHGGCSARHAGKAALALWQCKPARLVILATVVAIALLLLPGCASTGGKSWNPLTRVFGRKAAAEAKAEVKANALEDRAVDAAQVEVVKTGLALAAAPESRPVEVARRTNGNAAAYLNQRKPLNAATLAEIQGTVAGLLSEETAKREAAERAQSGAEKRNQGMAQELEVIRGKLIQLGKERAEEAANNLALANELRWKTIVAWSGTALSVGLGLLSIAYRLNIGRFQTGAAEVIATLKAKHGDAAASAARGAFDTVLHTGEQKGVAKAFFTLTQSNVS